MDPNPSCGLGRRGADCQVVSEAAEDGRCSTREDLRKCITGWVRLIRSDLLARFCFELSGNSNYNIKQIIKTIKINNICQQPRN